MTAYTGDSGSYLGSCTFLNMTGDLTVVWDEQNREKMLALIKKKMDEGYSFFTTKKFAFKRLSRKVKVTPKNVDQIEEIIVTDEQFEKMCADMNDKDIATLVRGNDAGLAKRTGKKQLDAMVRARKPEDVIGRDSLAVRPVVGG